MIQISFGVDQYSINIVEIWPFSEEIGRAHV